MYTAVGRAPHPEWVPYAESLVRSRMGLDLIGRVVEAEPGVLASCGLANISPRLPQPGVSATSIAYIQWVSTAEGHRGRGYASQVMRDLITDCDARSVRVVELHATAEARGIYQELGFFVKDDNVAMMLVRPLGIPDDRPPLYAPPM